MTRKENKPKKAAASKKVAKSIKATLLPRFIKFHSIKGPCFRSVQADGAWGSVNPQGNIHLIFFNERAPVPQEVVFNLNPDGTLGDEITNKRVSKDGMVREMEVDVVLSIKAATNVYKWLGDALAAHNGGHNAT